MGGQTVQIRLPAGPYLKVEGGAAPNPPMELTVFGQTLKGRFAFEQYTAPASPQSPGAPQKLVRIAITDLEFHLEAGGANIVSLTEGEGFFVIKPAGLAGRVSGHFEVAPSLGIEVSGTLSLAFNNSGAVAVGEQFSVGSQTVALNLPAGPYLRLEGTGLNLRVAGQRLSGNFAFEQSTTTGTTPTKVVRVIASNVNVGLGDGTTDFLTLTNGSAVLLLKQAGLAGRIGGTVSVNIPGVSLGGDFEIAINTTNAAIVNAVFELSSTETLTLNLRRRTVYARGRSPRLSGRAGAELSGNFVFEQLTRSNGQRVVRLALTEGSLSLGDPENPVVEVTHGTGKLLLNAGRLAGEFGGDLDINIDPEHPVHRRAERRDLQHDGGGSRRFPHRRRAHPPRTSGRSLSARGNRQCRCARLAVGARPDLERQLRLRAVDEFRRPARVRVAAANVGLSLGGVVEVVDGEGFFIISPDGLAGKLAASVSLNVPADISFSGRFGLSINKTGRAVNEQFTVGGTTLFLNLPAGPFIRVEGTGVQLERRGPDLERRLRVRAVFDAILARRDAQCDAHHRAQRHAPSRQRRHGRGDADERAGEPPADERRHGGPVERDGVADCSGRSVRRKLPARDQQHGQRHQRGVQCHGHQRRHHPHLAQRRPRHRRGPDFDLQRGGSGERTVCESGRGGA